MRDAARLTPIVRVIVGALVGAAMTPVFMVLAHLVALGHFQGWPPRALSTVLMACIPGYVLANIADFAIGLQQIIDPLRVVLNAAVYSVSWVSLTAKSLWLRLLVGIAWAAYVGWMFLVLRP